MSDYENDYDSSGSEYVPGVHQVLFLLVML